jgi:two-component system, OmpR family, response regulator
VLIVDDDAGFVQLVTRYLQDSGMSITWAGTGEEATRMIAEQAPEVVLLDLVLPDGNGLQILRSLPATGGATAPRVFLVTSGDYSEDMLTQHEGVLAISRRRGYNTSETITYLQALLDATETRPPADSEPAQPAAATG